MRGPAGGYATAEDSNPKGETNIYWVYGVRAPRAVGILVTPLSYLGEVELLPSVPCDAEEVMKRLAAAKVGTRQAKIYSCDIIIHTSKQ